MTSGRHGSVLVVDDDPFIRKLIATTLDRPKGTLEGTRQTFTLDTNDQLFNASQFRKVILAYQNGAPVTVKDVATVIDSSVNPRSGAWFDGKQTGGVTAGASAPEILVQQVVERLRSWGGEMPTELPGSQETVVFGLPRMLRTRETV